MPPRAPSKASLRTLLRIRPRQTSQLPHSPPARRYQSSNAPPPPPPNTSQARIDRILSRLPKFLHPWTSGLRNAPVSHITSFLLLHELTAIVPLIGLATLFHYTSWLPQSFAEGKWVSQGVDQFGRYFGRKGWFGFEREAGAAAAASARRGSVGVNDEGMGEKEREAVIEKRWGVGGRGSRILVEVATAYAITKVLMPVRIVVSVWGTPWFARAVVGRFWGMFGVKNTSAVAKFAEVSKKMP